jgi:MFS family permease
MRLETPPRADAPQPTAEPAPAVRPHLSLDSLTRGFSALAIRNYRLFWIGQLISLTGSWMQRTAQDWLVIQLTHSPFALGLVTVCQFLPVTLLSLVGGVITDRWPKRRLLLVTQSASLLQAVIFTGLVATGTIEIWHVYILAAVQGLINALDNPTRQAFVPELVGRAHLVNAIALNSMLFNGARVMGPAVAGLLIAQFGIAPALGLNAVSFLAVIAGLLLMDGDTLAGAVQMSRGPVGRRLLDGLRYVGHTPPILLVMLLMAAIGTFGYNFSVVLPLVAGFLLKTDAAGFGGLSAFVGLGSLIAALITAYARHVGRRRLVASAALFSLILGGVALSTHFALTALLLMALGCAGVVFTTSANTLLQLTVPNELRGRVMSLYILLFAGTTPIGGFLIGTLSSSLGAVWALLICAALCLVGVAGALLYDRRTRARTPGPLSAS